MAAPPVTYVDVTLDEPPALTCTIDNTNGVWHTREPSDIFRIQRSLRRTWGFEVVLLEDLPPDTTLMYTGSRVRKDPQNGYTFALSDGRFLNGLATARKSIALLFNDDYDDVIDRKCVWTAVETSDFRIQFYLEYGGRAGDICCVSYGNDFFAEHAPYVDYFMPDIVEYWQ